MPAKWKLTAVGLLLVAVLMPPPLSRAAQAEWKSVYPAAQYRLFHRRVKGKPCIFRVVKIDMEVPGTSIVVSPPKLIGTKTSDFAEQMDVQVAVNGSFWKLVTHDPLGLVVSAGRRWPDSRDDDKYGYLAFSKDGEAWISPPEKKKHPSPEDGWMVIPGYPMIVRNGERDKTRGCGYICMTGPRTAVGLDADASTLYLVVVDGRQTKSGGTDLTNLADFMIEQGVHDALNLDGGGSSTLYIQSMGGRVNVPSEGRERAVLNNLGIYLARTVAESEPPMPPDQAPDASASSGPPAPPDPEDPASPLVTFDDADFETEGHPDPPRLLKMLLGMGGLFAVLLVVTVLVVVIVLKRRKRRTVTPR